MIKQTIFSLGLCIIFANVAEANQNIRRLEAQISSNSTRIVQPALNGMCVHNNPTIAQRYEAATTNIRFVDGENMSIVPIAITNRNCIHIYPAICSLTLHYFRPSDNTYQRREISYTGSGSTDNEFSWRDLNGDIHNVLGAEPIVGTQTASVSMSPELCSELDRAGLTGCAYEPDMCRRSDCLGSYRAARNPERRFDVYNSGGRENARRACIQYQHSIRVTPPRTESTIRCVGTSSCGRLSVQGVD